MADFIETHMQAAGMPGMKADSGYDDRVESFPAESFVPFGNVAIVNDDGTVKVGGGGRAVGIAVHTHSIPDTGYRTYDVAGCMQKGSIWARAAAGAVTANGGAVYYTPSGEVTNVADGNTLLPHAAFRGQVRSKSGKANIVLVQLHSPLAA